MPDGLGEHEHAVERQRRDRGERELAAGELRAGLGRREAAARTRVSVASVTTVASAEPVPSGLKTAKSWRSAADQDERPTMPLTEIITAANTVLRARPALVPGRRSP